ncbi:Fic/DOC family protein [Nocardia suismassiliense]|uniref:Fic/DOC family protein n=1 Tax=Nocardia suismassiliense TaxID=2077092 RepID=UPI00131F42FD|nr:Fic family protein [Nocardia suismassiliense]
MLRNKFGIRDPDELREREFAETAKRALELETGRLQIPRTGDGAELRAIHGHLFDAIYEWAGQYRTVELDKGPSGARFAPVRVLVSLVESICETFRDLPWHRFERGRFAVEAGRCFTHLNAAHPFREGNGRASRLFLASITRGASFEIDYSATDSVTWNQACALSMTEGKRFDAAPLIELFHDLAVDRTDRDGRATATSELAAVHPAAGHHSHTRTTGTPTAEPRSGPELAGVIEAVNAAASGYITTGRRDSPHRAEPPASGDSLTDLGPSAESETGSAP